MSKTRVDCPILRARPQPRTFRGVDIPPNIGHRDARHQALRLDPRRKARFSPNHPTLPKCELTPTRVLQKFAQPFIEFGDGLPRTSREEFQDSRSVRVASSLVFSVDG